MKRENKMIGRTMHLTIKAILGRLGANFLEADVPLSPDQFIVLMLVSQNDGIIQQDLAEFMRKDKSAMLRQIDLLQDRRLIARISDPKDKRRNQIVLTQQGAELLGEAKKMHQKTMEQVLKGISEEQLNTFTQVAESIQKSAESHKS
jgi:DNA-binding MarR family transcriptional regulator